MYFWKNLNWSVFNIDNKVALMDKRYQGMSREEDFINSLSSIGVIDSAKIEYLGQNWEDDLGTD